MELPNQSNRSQFTYKQKMSGSDLYRYIKAVALPAGVFILSLIATRSLAGFGTKLVAPLTAVMWCVGIICALLLPSHRGTIMSETHVTLAAYLSGLLALKQVVSLMSGVSSEMLMEAFDQAIPATSGAAISGWLQTLMWVTAAMTPVGFIGMQIKRVYSFKRTTSKEKFFERMRGIRSNKMNKND